MLVQLFSIHSGILSVSWDETHHPVQCTMGVQIDYLDALGREQRLHQGGSDACSTL